ncbi:MAG: phosphoglycerate kinase [Parcubacteria group bacterium Gr01-1014_29]|nr:MAG: phosphoglycerate kinase [Parcubacteria group bacterium Gr01-1014_29]
MLSQKLPVFNKSVTVSNKRVIVRVDFNVPLEHGGIADDYRIIKTLPLLEQLRSGGARLVLLSHLTEKKEHRSFAALVDELNRIVGLGMVFAKSVEEARQNGADVVLLENLRVFPGEERNDVVFAEELSTLGDIFINEGFSQSHRPYASIMHLPKLLPSYAGPLFYEEVMKLEEALNPERPFMLVLGGVKFATKVGVLEHFMKTADKIFVGGALANTFLAAKGHRVGASPVEKDAFEYVREMFLNSPNLMLPSDVRVGENKTLGIGNIGERDVVYDIGPASSDALGRVLGDMKMILWNGPLGCVEEGYGQGTANLLSVLAATKAKVIIGGGDTLAVVRNQGLENRFYHLSTGGGAMLEFLAKGTLPGIEAILDNTKD